MLKRLLQASAAMTFSLFTANHGAWAVPGPVNDLAPRLSSEPEIRVRLFSARPEMELAGAYLTLQGDAMIAAREPWSRWRVACDSRGVRIRSAYSQRFQPVGARLEVRPYYGKFQLGASSFRGSLTLMATSHGCQAVNRVKIEDYLAGLVNAEFSSKWSYEAVKAQVVAARSYALARIQSGGVRRWDVESSVRDQVYTGMEREDGVAWQAVRQTRGEVLTLSRGRGPASSTSRALVAYYHSTCGGMTELPQNVWGRGQQGYRKSVSCPFCSGSPKRSWEMTLSSQDVLAAAGIVGPPQNARFEIEKAPSGRVSRVSVEGVDASGRSHRVQMDAGLFRERIGTQKLPSLNFDALVTISGGQWKLKGRGYGHGVGLCQFGAKAMGEQGRHAKEILAHYYPEAQLKRLW